MRPRRLRLPVLPAESGEELSPFLRRRGGLTTADIDAALARGAVWIAQRRVSDSRRVLRSGELVEVVLAEAGRTGRMTNGIAPIEANRLIHLDSSVVAVDKPPRLAAQGTRLDADEGLDRAVAEMLRVRGERNTFAGLVHRLDLDTSGVTVFGRTAAATSALAEAFRTGSVVKTYHLLVAGWPEWDTRLVDAPLGPAPGAPGRQQVDPKGKPAATEFRVLERSGPSSARWSRLEARPRTGRTHQIRVHAQSVGHPLLGDPRYGGPDLLAHPDGTPVVPPRTCLHALRLRIPHPSGSILDLSAPWPTDLEALTRALAGDAPPAG